MNDIAVKDRQGSALAIVDTQDLAALFGAPGSIDDVLQRIEDEVRSYAPDISTSKGRKAIASLAAKVARSKTALDAAGKALNDDRRAAINAVDAERRKLRDRLDALKIEARAPLTEWEAAEEARIAKHTDGIAKLRDLANASDDATSDEIADAISAVEGVVIDGSWDEFESEAGARKTSLWTDFAAACPLRRRGKRSRLSSPAFAQLKKSATGKRPLSGPRRIVLLSWLIAPARPGNTLQRSAVAGSAESPSLSAS